MPRLKSLLADQGVTFTNTMMATPLCAPNRATLFTGLYTHNHGITGNVGAQGTQPMESNLLPVWLKQAGLRTSLAGKYINQYPDSAAARPASLRAGTTGTACSRTGRPRATTTSSTTTASSPIPPSTRRTFSPTGPTTSSTRRRRRSQPFFVLVGPGAPHSPVRSGRTARRSLCGQRRRRRTPSFNEEDVSDKPQWLRNNLSYLGRLARSRSSTTSTPSDSRACWASRTWSTRSSRRSASTGKLVQYLDLLHHGQRCLHRPAPTGQGEDRGLRRRVPRAAPRARPGCSRRPRSAPSHQHRRPSGDVPRSCGRQSGQPRRKVPGAAPRRAAPPPPTVAQGGSGGGLHERELRSHSGLRVHPNRPSTRSSTFPASSSRSSTTSRPIRTS